MRRLGFLAFIWGWSFLFIKVAVEGMTPTTVAAARIGLGATVLLLVCRRRGLRVPTGLEHVRHYVVTGFFGCALPFTLLAWGEQHITSALTAVLNASTALFTAMFGVVLLRERLRPVQVAGLLLGLVGVAVAAGLGGHDLADSSILGSLASIGAGASYGLSFTWIKRHLMDIPGVAAAAGQLTTATLLLAPLAVATTAADGIHLAPRRVLAVVLLGAVGTGIAYLLYYEIVRELGPTKASLVTYLIPVVAVAVGIAFLDEEFHLRLLVGGVLIVGGIVLVHRRNRARVIEGPLGTVPR